MKATNRIYINRHEGEAMSEGEGGKERENEYLTNTKELSLLGQLSGKFKYKIA